MDLANLSESRSGGLTLKPSMAVDDYLVDSDSEFDDDGLDNSSDEDIDIMLNGTLAQRQKVMKNRQIGPKEPELSSEDEFEKEMNSELKERMKQFEAEKPTDKPEGQAGSSKDKEMQDQYYDNEYFDSDTDDEGTRTEKEGRKRRIPTNDELLYDPNMDGEDQKWVDDQRRRSQGSRRKKAQAKDGEQTAAADNPKLPISDAVLNCPACMATVCRDCQRHSLYKNQYRAMFVVNCRVVKDELLSFPKNKAKKKCKRKGNAMETNTEEPTASGEAEKYNPVRCDTCNTEIGVYDDDEIYHFFNVLASYS